MLCCVLRPKFINTILINVLQNTVCIYMYIKIIDQSTTIIVVVIVTVNVVLAINI